MPSEKRESIRVFIGHSLFATGIPAADDARIVTFLREPVSRVISFINYVAAGRTAVSLKSSRTFSIDDFLESDNLEISNLQTKILINKDRLDSESMLQQMGRELALELAKEHLFQGLHTFGLQDRFDESWVAIWHSLGIKPPLYATMNKGSNTKTLKFSEAQIERIRELNQLDLKLYQAASVEFDRRLKEGLVPQTVLAKFQDHQRKSGPRFTRIWNLTRNSFYVYRRTKRRIFGR